jgi:sugar phosphate isomerase/epimerase
MPFPYRLGVVDVVYAQLPTIEERARRARDDGFAHIDPLVGTDPDSIALPIGCPTAFPRPQAGWCSTPAPADAPGRWEKTVERFRAAPGCLMEPWAGSVVGSTERVLAMLDAVPGLQLLVDTGHVSDWGGDAIELLPYARHVQLRQGTKGATQLHVDDPRGAVDFAAVVGCLERLGYEGMCSVEYFDLPEQGWPLADPRAWALDLAAHLRGFSRF